MYGSFGRYATVVIYGEEKGKNGFKGNRNKGMAQEN